MPSTTGDSPVSDTRTGAVNELDEQCVSFEQIAAEEQRARMIETIAMLDGAATAMSAPHLTEADLAEITALHRTIEHLSQAPPDALAGSRLTDACDMLHSALVARCPNRRLRELVDEELTLLHAVDSGPIPRPDDWRAVVREHAELLTLVHDRADATMFTLALRRHRRLCH